MSLKCLSRYDDGSYCKRWAKKGSRYCHAHRPAAFNDPTTAKTWPGLHPFTRLASPSDLFDLLRESLNAARMGTMPPGQAASIATLSNAWLKAFDRLNQQHRIEALDCQIVPTLMDADSAAHAERLATATEENERAADLIAELDHIVDYGPDPATQPGDDTTQSPAPGATDYPPAAAIASDSGALHSANPHEAQPSHSSLVTGHSSLPSHPVNLREAQAKLEAMLAEQHAANSSAKPNGDSS